MASPPAGLCEYRLNEFSSCRHCRKRVRRGGTTRLFRYRHKGSLAVIGRNAAVADFGVLRFGGPFAWLAWPFVHIAYLIEFYNKLKVLFQWAWRYVTRKRGARPITGEDPFPLIDEG